MLVLAQEADGAARRAAVPALQCPSAGSRDAAIARTVDGGSFVTKTGEEILLAGILAAGRGGETLSSGGTDDAKRALARMLSAGPVTLAQEPAPDRYGRLKGQVFAGGQWVQGAMVRAGLARAAPDSGSGPCAAPLLRLEEEARAAGAGHWGDGLFLLRPPTDMADQIGTFQIVDGTVVDADIVRGRAFLNFGADYKTDFTVTVAPADMQAFRRQRRDWPAFSGRHVRVRGWIDSYNGPEMEIVTPAALEVLK
jgi:endonuclease YncB( thermonuclease family)